VPVRFRLPVLRSRLPGVSAHRSVGCFFYGDFGGVLFQAVIFDMDGVIVDTEPLHKKTERVTLSPFGITLTDGELDSYMGTEARLLMTRFIERFHLNVTFDDLYASYKSNLIRLFGEGVPPVPGAFSLIRALSSAGVPIAVGSSSHRNLVELVLSQTGLADRFTAVVSGDDASRSKPHPDIFLEAARRLGVLPGRCVVIEDSTNGVAAAKAAGMFCVGFRNPNSTGQDLTPADWVVRSMDEITVGRLRALAGEEAGLA
jgi:HAD superfamily hydrolase (TIGR01509 family)